MIYVTLGTQGRDFTRCLKMVEELIKNRNLKDKVIAQVGATKYQPQGVECFEFVNENDYQKYVQDANVIITHAGSGALFSCIKKGKKAIAVARLSEYGEMIDNHQTELVKKLSEEGYILDGTYSIVAAWDKLKDFTPRLNDFECSLQQNIGILLNDWGIKQKR